MRRRIAARLAPVHVIFASYGNDSIALMQWAKDRGLEGVVVAHSDTGWGAPDWADRVRAGMRWAMECGFDVHTMPSEGMESLVRRKKGWPLTSKFKFCTEALKITPAKNWLAEVDPAGDAVCLVGVRREESLARRQWPVWLEESDKHGGRSLWSPLAKMGTAERDVLIEKAGFDVLPYRSKECFPCVNANRSDLRGLTEERVAFIEALENDMGYTSNGKLRTIFRPYHHQGATGIRQVWEWAKCERGEYGKRQLVVLGEGTGCDSGMCGEG